MIFLKYQIEVKLESKPKIKLSFHSSNNTEMKSFDLTTRHTIKKMGLC